MAHHGRRQHSGQSLRRRRALAEPILSWPDPYMASLRHRLLVELHAWLLVACQTSQVRDIVRMPPPQVREAHFR